jgi:hypothetical protein
VRSKRERERGREKKREKKKIRKKIRKKRRKNSLHPLHSYNLSPKTQNYISIPHTLPPLPTNRHSYQSKKEDE